MGRRRALFFLGAVLAGLHAWRYRAYVSDDAYISFRYAERWISGLGLTFTDAERVEGYTNPLWTLALGVLMKLGLGARISARVLGVTSALVVLGASIRIAARTIEGWPRLVVPLGLAMSGSIAVWMVGGLEPVSVLALFVLALSVVDENGAWRTADVIAFVLLPQARLDAALLAGGIVLGASWSAGRLVLVRESLALVGGLALATAVRWLYYGDYVPNTARAKLGHPQLAYGLAYAGHFLLTMAPLLPFALYALARRGPLAKRVAPALILSLSYVVLVGGDFMPGYRFLVPTAGMLVLLAAEGVAALPSGLYAVAATCAALGTCALAQQVDPYVVEAESTTWADDGVRLGLALKDAFPERPLLAVDAAGAMPFASRLPTIDLLGLTDRHIARSPASGHVMPGHAVGDGNYVWERAPDLIVFNGPSGGPPTFASGQQLVARPDFSARYAPLVLHVGDLVTHAYVRKDGRIARVAGAELTLR